MFEYADAFKVNLGVFSEDEQRRIKDGKVAILGCGGVGGTSAVILARSGVGAITIVDPQRYEISNMNRQIGCFVDTVGEYKVDVLQRELARINPDCRVEAMRDIDFDGLDRIVMDHDVIVPAADDFAFSIMCIRAAKRGGKPAVIGYPTGCMSRVCTFTPESVDPEDCFGLPKNLDYETLKEILSNPKYRKWGRLYLRRYMKLGCWRREWMDEFVDGRVSLSQIAPVVWLTSSLVGMEVLKLLTNKWKPVVAPMHWMVIPTRAEIRKFDPPKIGPRLLKFYLESKR